MTPALPVEGDAPGEKVQRKDDLYREEIDDNGTIRVRWVRLPEPDPEHWVEW